MSPKILIVEDEEQIASFLRRGLTYEGYEVETAADGTTALGKARDARPDLVVLDLMLPGMDGLEVCRRLRTAHSSLPILILTARDSVSDRVQGLDAGSDDYMVKPFALAELLARVRRPPPPRRARRTRSLQFADLKLDTGTRQVHRGETRIELTSKEFDLLELFLRHPRQVLTRETIYDRVWGYDFGGESNIIEVYIRYLRQKLEADGRSRLLFTVRGVGYVLREETSTSREGAFGMSLRARLIFGYSVLLAAILFLFGASLYFILRYTLTQQIDQALQDSAEDILSSMTVRSVEDLKFLNASPAAVSFLERLRPGLERGRRTALLVPQYAKHPRAALPRGGWPLEGKGTPISYGPNLGTPTATIGIHPASGGGGAVFGHQRPGDCTCAVITKTIWVRGRFLGLLQVGTPLTVVDRALLDTFARLAIGGGSAVLISILLGNWIALGALQPLEAVTTTAIQITRADDLSRRIPLEVSPPARSGV